MSQGMILKINGVEINSKIAKCKIANYDLDVDSYRDIVTGNLVRNKLTSKNKLFVEIPYIRLSEIRSFLNLIQADRFTVEYYDMYRNQIRTGVFYHGDIELNPYMEYSNGDFLLEPIQINFIEY